MDHGHVTPEVRLSPISSPWNGLWPDVIPRLRVTKAGCDADNEILLLCYGVSRPDVGLQPVCCPLSVACPHVATSILMADKHTVIYVLGWACCCCCCCW